MKFPGMFGVLILLAIGYTLGAKWPGLYRGAMAKIAADA